jgi:hypothetical protein
VKDGNYYRCSEKTKGFCLRESERLINAKNLERKLGRLREKFLLPKGEALRLFEKIMPLYFHNLMKSGKRGEHLQNCLEATGNIMIEDLKNRGKIKRSDFVEFKKLYFELIKNFYADILFGFLINLIFVLAKEDSEQGEIKSQLNKFYKTKSHDLNHSFAVNLKKIYLSGEGKIENIELEGFSWFSFLYIQKEIPEYRPKTKERFILNTKRFNSLDPFEIIEEFKKNNFIGTFSDNVFTTKYAKEKLLNKIFGGFNDLSNQEKIDYLIKLNSPTPEYIKAMFFSILRN